MEVELSIRKVSVKPIKFVQMASVEGENKEQAMTRTIRLGSDLTDEEIANLNVKDGMKLIKAINELNFSDFQ